jgi:ABC-2 type transport system ATP-binding protein
MKAVIAENLMKTYNKGSVQALDGLSLDVEEGTVLGVLGPNGAGWLHVEGHDQILERF